MSTMFLWHRIEHATGNYHQEGSIAIIADSLAAARALLREYQQATAYAYAVERVPDVCEVWTEEPTETFELVGSQEPRIFFFPNAGCC